MAMMIPFSLIIVASTFSRSAPTESRRHYKILIPKFRIDDRQFIRIAQTSDRGRDRRGGFERKLRTSLSGDGESKIDNVIIAFITEKFNEIDRDSERNDRRLPSSR